MFGMNKTVDSVIGVFSQAIDDLSAIGASEMLKVAKCEEEVRALRDIADTARAEADRANKYAENIKAMLNG